jgi:hypothetical protein
MKLATLLAEIGGQAVDRMRPTFAFRFAFGVVLAAGLAACGGADWPSDHGSAHGRHRDLAPVYQRHAFDWLHRGGHWQGRGRMWPASQASAGWFQRPYPYHLDYYRMRYGGSYAPYFGNLYGPPQVVTAPPYYGPYYGGYGAYGGYGPPVDYGPQPIDAPYQRGLGPHSGNQTVEEPGDEGLPTPAP